MLRVKMRSITAQDDYAFAHVCLSVSLYCVMSLMTQKLWTSFHKTLERAGLRDGKQSASENIVER